MTAEMRGYARAQREWESREPTNGGICECQNCAGKGEPPDPTNEDGVPCEVCGGFGLLTDSGDPHDPDAAECEWADRQRDARLTGDL